MSKKCKIPGHGVTTFSTEGSLARMEEEMKIKLCATQTKELQESMRKVYNTVWGQFTEYRKARIEASDEHAKLRQEVNPIDLLKVMQNLQCQQSELEYCVEAVIKAEENFYYLKQYEHESDNNFYGRFNNSKKFWSEAQVT